MERLFVFFCIAASGCAQAGVPSVGGNGTPDLSVGADPPDLRAPNTPTDLTIASTRPDLLTPPDLTASTMPPDLAMTTPPDLAGMTGCTPDQHLVINELQTAGPTSGNDKWLELYNPCDSAVDLSGWKLLYRSASGVSPISLVTFTGSITGTGYLLIAGPGYLGSVTPDYTWSSGALAAAAGGAAVANPAGTIVDSVGWGTASNVFIEGTVASAPPAAQSIGRHPNGTDSDNNVQDFIVYSTPSPRAPNL